MTDYTCIRVANVVADHDNLLIEGVARYQEMATLPEGYIPQPKVSSASSRGSLDFIAVKC